MIFTVYVCLKVAAAREEGEQDLRRPVRGQGLVVALGTGQCPYLLI